ncbi:MAG: tail fiber domain-containing protein [Deltaproteobacteria bacterium]|nr:tail fiber domain-containing protein [Deltaproteobacteria bacterium]
MTTRANLLLGEDYEGWEGFCDTLVNYLKNNWRMSDPVGTLSLAKPGMVASDSDDNKLWHRVDVASGYCWQSGAPEWDEVLQANYSCDTVPKFKGVDFYDSCCGNYARMLSSNGYFFPQNDFKTDRWLEQISNTFFGVDVVGAGNLAHGSGDEGYYNSVFGQSACYSITTGRQNSAFGQSACYSITTGGSNCAFGQTAGYLLTGGFYNCFFGRTAGYSVTTGSLNCAFGQGAGRYQSDGSSALQTPENSIYIGALVKSGSNPAGGEDDIDNEIVIGYNATGNGANTIQLGNSNITEFHCQVALTVDSDRRIKRDITPLSGGLAFINALKPITFRRLNPADWPDQIKPAEYKDREIEEFDEMEGKLKKRLEKALPRPDDVDHVELGLVAQEVEEVLNAQGLDYNIVNTNPQGRKSLKYATLVVPLIKAVQELSARVAALEARRTS